MAQFQKQILSMQVGMAKIDLLLNKEVEDPRFETASFDAQKSVQVAEQKLKDIDVLFERKRIQALEQSSVEAENLVSIFEKKARSLNCPDLTSIGGGKRGIETCRKAALSRILDSAQAAKISVCLLTSISTEAAIAGCAKELNK